MRKILLPVLLLLNIFITYAFAEDRVEIEIQLTDHGFVPDQLNVLEGQKLKIHLTNETDKVAEFESFDLKFEKIAPPKSKIYVFTGSLKPGKYRFFDDFSADQISGMIEVSPE